MTTRECARCHQVKPHRARGYCSACYVALRKAGAFTPMTREGKPTPPRKCDDCGVIGPYYARGLCTKCYRRRWHAGDLETVTKEKRPDRCTQCGRGWDETMYQAKGMCNACYTKYGHVEHPARFCACGAFKRFYSVRCLDCEKQRRRDAAEARQEQRRREKEKARRKAVSPAKALKAPQNKIRTNDEAAAHDPGLAAFLRNRRKRVA